MPELFCHKDTSQGTQSLHFLPFAVSLWHYSNSSKLSSVLDWTILYLEVGSLDDLIGQSKIV